MKNKIKIILGITITLPIIYFGIYYIQNKTLKNSYVKESKMEFGKDRFLIRCNSNIFKPEFAYVFSGHIAFLKVNEVFCSSYESWEKSYIGGVTVKNTTFKNLVSMVKEDCHQFQESGSVGLEDNAIQWVYSKAEDSKKNKEREKKRKEKEKGEREEWNKLSQEEKDKILEENKKIDGYQKLSDEEKLKILREKFKD